MVGLTQFVLCVLQGGDVLQSAHQLYWLPVFVLNPTHRAGPHSAPFGSFHGQLQVPRLASANRFFDRCVNDALPFSTKVSQVSLKSRFEIGVKLKNPFVLLRPFDGARAQIHLPATDTGNAFSAVQKAVTGS